MSRTSPTLIGALALTLGLGGCAETATEPVTLTDDTIIIDVRTPQEYAQEHLKGAQLLDLTSGDLAAALPALDTGAEYLVYCQSGNRSAQATTMLGDAGLNVTDLGSLDEAATATRLPIVD